MADIGEEAQLGLIHFVLLGGLHLLLLLQEGAAVLLVRPMGIQDDQPQAYQDIQSKRRAGQPERWANVDNEFGDGVAVPIGLVHPHLQAIGAGRQLIEVDFVVRHTDEFLFRVSPVSELKFVLRQVIHRGYFDGEVYVRVIQSDTVQQLDVLGQDNSSGLVRFAHVDRSISHIQACKAHPVALRFVLPDVGTYGRILPVATHQNFAPTCAVDSTGIERNVAYAVIAEIGVTAIQVVASCRIFHDNNMNNAFLGRDP